MSKFTLKRLIPLDSELPRCGAQRSSSYLYDKRETDRQCHFRGVIDINGVSMCRKHAGSVALDILLEMAEKP